MKSKKKSIDTIVRNVGILLEREKNNEEQLRLCARQLDELFSESSEWSEQIREISLDINATPLFNVTLCKLLGKRSEIRSSVNDMLVGDIEEVSDTAKGRIAYVRNKRNDKMFLEFSKAVSGAKAYYSASFADACEAVFNNTCEFCILPVYNGKEGKLYSFYNMLDRYDLKIAHTVTEDEGDSQELVTFALVGRELITSVHGYGKCRFEFSLIDENAVVVARVTAAVGELGGMATDVGTMPVAYDRPRRKFYLSADIPKEGIIPLAMYLSMENMGFEVLGLYEI